MKNKLFNLDTFKVHGEAGQAANIDYLMGVLNDCDEFLVRKMIDFSWGWLKPEKGESFIPGVDHPVLLYQGWPWFGHGEL